MKLDPILKSALRGALSRREWEKIESLMEARGDRSLQQIIHNLVKVIPASVKPRHALDPELVAQVEKIERENQYIALYLKDGRVLRSFPSRQQYRNYYYCFRDQVPEMIDPDSYQLVYDLAFRLGRGDQMIRNLQDKGLFVQSDTTNIIECGAYNGWKALGFANHIGSAGKVALEIDRDQYELCKANLGANLPENNFEVLHMGVWNAEEEREYSYEHYASQTLNTPDEHQHHTQTRTVKTNTLDNIIDLCKLETVDFLNIQTGGSEFETLEGLSRNLERVKCMWVGSHYRHEGVSIRWKSIDHLLQKGCRIYFDNLNRQPLEGIREVTDIATVNKEDTGGFWAVSSPYASELCPPLGN